MQLSPLALPAHPFAFAWIPLAAPAKKMEKKWPVLAVALVKILDAA